MSKARLHSYTGLAAMLLSQPLLAADGGVSSPAASLAKTLLGLIAVLAVMAAIAWLAKRIGPARQGGQSAVRIVGGVSVGTREKVVVVEVGGRWLVVGVAPGQVNAIANLDIVDGGLAAEGPDNPLPGVQTLGAKGQAFAGWLKTSLEKSRGR